jgi:hypothetical protein
MEVKIKMDDIEDIICLRIVVHLGDGQVKMRVQEAFSYVYGGAICKTLQASVIKKGGPT